MTFLLFLLFSVPIDLPITKREIFNRWYSSAAYYLALLISDVPVILLCVSIYVTVIYTLTDQPLEMFRFVNFLLIGVCACFTAQAYGMLMGSFFKMNVSNHTFHLELLSKNVSGNILVQS